jgi:hypothetical protein
MARPQVEAGIDSLCPTPLSIDLHRIQATLDSRLYRFPYPKCSSVHRTRFRQAGRPQASYSPLDRQNSLNDSYSQSPAIEIPE